MSRNLAELEARQRVLQVRAAQERVDFSQHFEPIEKPLSWADKGIDAFNFMKSSPIYGLAHLLCWHTTSLNWPARSWRWAGAP